MPITEPEMPCMPNFLYLGPKCLNIKLVCKPGPEFAYMGLKYPNFGLIFTTGPEMPGH
jgi:hypothetical protein